MSQGMAGIPPKNLERKGGRSLQPTTAGVWLCGLDHSLTNPIESSNCVAVSLPCCQSNRKLLGWTQLHMLISIVVSSLLVLLAGQLWALLACSFLPFFSFQTGACVSSKDGLQVYM